MKTITIVGGGLAGLVLGLRLRQLGVEVRLYEKRAYPQHKVCGEFISGVSQATLQRLQLMDHLSDACKISDVEWFIRDKKIFRHHFKTAALGISRFHLDRLLAERFEQLGGVIIKQKVTLEQQQEGTVWAAGKPMNRGGRWIGLSMHLESRTTPMLEMYSGPGGYIGLSPIEQGKTNVTGLFKKKAGVKGKGSELMIQYLKQCGLGQLANSLQNEPVVEGSFCAISGFEFGPNKSEVGCVIGDAAQLIPPFVGNGMSMAIESADTAAGHLLQYASGEMNWQQAVDLLSQETAGKFSRRMRIASLFHPLLLSGKGLRAIAWSSRMNLLPTKTLYQWTR